MAKKNDGFKYLSQALNILITGVTLLLTTLAVVAILTLPPASAIWCLAPIVVMEALALNKYFSKKGDIKIIKSVVDDEYPFESPLMAAQYADNVLTGKPEIVSYSFAGSAPIRIRPEDPRIHNPSRRP